MGSDEQRAVWAAQFDFLDKSYRSSKRADDADEGNVSDASTPTSEAESAASSVGASMPTWLRKADAKLKASRGTTPGRRRAGPEGMQTPPASSTEPCTDPTASGGSSVV